MDPTLDLHLERKSSSNKERAGERFIISDKKREFGNTVADRQGLSKSQRKRARKNRNYSKVRDEACRTQLELDDLRENKSIEINEVKDRACRKIEGYKGIIVQQKEVIQQLKSESSDHRIARLIQEKSELEVQLDKYARTSRDLSASLVASFSTQLADTRDRSDSEYSC